MDSMFILGAVEGFDRFIVPLVILLLAIAFVIVLRVMASRYMKIAPNEVGIFYGRRYKFVDENNRVQVRGFRVVAGGGSLLWPVVERLQVMSTAVTQAEIDERGIPNKDNVKINARGIATFKISTMPEHLNNAAMAFLGKSNDEIRTIVQNILQGHLRSIIGKLDIQEILRDRDAFNKMVVDESTEELKRLGIQIITLVIQEVNDEYGYIDALGRRAVAEAIKDANIKVAQAESVTQKQVSDAQREAAVTVAGNAVQTSEAEKNRDVQKAKFKIEAETSRAQAELAFQVATVEKEKELKVKQAERDAAEKKAQISVQEQESARVQKQLEATRIRVAEAERQAVIIQAEGEKQVAVLTAEASKAKQITEAEGSRQAKVLEGEGEAQRTRAILLAQADGEAAKTRQNLMALAEGEAAKKKLALIGEAEGTQKLADALAKMTKDAKMILVLDRLPVLIDRVGESGSKIATSIFSSVAAPFGSIDKLNIVDLGANGKGLGQIGSVVPQTVFNFIASCKAMGMDPTKLASKFGIDVGPIVDMMQDVFETSEAAPARKVEAETVKKEYDVVPKDEKKRDEKRG